MSAIVEQYRAPAWWPMRRVASADTGGGRQVFAAWLILSLGAVALSILEARHGWGGIVAIGNVGVPVVLYPPLAVTLLIVFWLGPEWGIIPAYAATLARALSIGMPSGAAALFAFSTPIELLIMWGSMVVLETNPALRGSRDVLKYLLAGLIAACASSLSVLMWIEYEHLDLVASQRMWRGSVIGDLLQIIALMPAMRWAIPRARGWTGRRLDSAPRFALRHSTSVVLVTGIVLLMIALVFQGVWMSAHSLAISPDVRTADGAALLPRLREIALFLGLLTGLTVVTTTAFAAALARVGEREGGAARRDPLTGCLNRRAFDHGFDEAAERSRRVRKGLTVICFDVDHFKLVNDTWGHEAGDVLLRQLAIRVQAATREHDILFRWGGEEFVLLLPRTTPEEGLGAAERIRAAVAAHPLVRGEGSPIEVTISLGVVTAETFPADPDALLSVADAACYLAKRGGRNRIEDARRFSAETAEHPVGVAD